jgi:hypothetical protein
MDTLEWLSEWYQQQCDGGWEHGESILIRTLDNPGWMMRINLVGTPWEGLKFAPIEQERDEGNWWVVRMEEGRFVAYCGARNLLEVVTIFRNWVTTTEAQGRTPSS